MSRIERIRAELEALPELEELKSEELQKLLLYWKQKIALLDAHEPKGGAALEEWYQLHEELEDLADDLQELLDAE